MNVEALTAARLDAKRRAVSALKSRKTIAYLKALIGSLPAPLDLAATWQTADVDTLVLNIAGSSAQATTWEECPAVLIPTDGFPEATLLSDAIRDWREKHGVGCVAEDLLVDEYQIYWLRALGFDGFVVPCEMVDVAMAQYFVEIGRDLGITGALSASTRKGLATALATDGAFILIRDDHPADMEDLLEQAHTNMIPRVVLQQQDQFFTRSLFE